MIAEAHTKVNSSAMVSILQVIEVLKRRPTEDARRWVEALQQYRLKMTAKSTDRLNLICYICGQHPVRAASWIHLTGPHENYGARTALEAVEVHLHDVEQKIRAVYAKEAWQ